MARANNRITFQADGVTLHLKLERPWERSAGIQPDVNTAVAAGSELQPYIDNGSFPGTVSGTINFFFTDPNTITPDVSLQKIDVMGVEPIAWARTVPAPGAVVATKYRITFADWRNKLVWPRGGYLFTGEVNTQPVVGDTDANGNGYLNPQQLAQTIVGAMSLPAAVVPGSLSDQSPIYNLEWRGAHAPTELAKITDVTNHCVFCDATGSVQIVEIGTGNDLNVPAGRLITGMSYGSADRRAKVVVFSSAPNQSLVTQTISGFANSEGTDGSGDGGDDDNSSAAWEYVIQDSDGSWQTLANASYFQNVAPIDAWNSNLSAISASNRINVDQQMYRCIRLNRSNYGPAPFFRYIIEQREGSSNPNDWVYSEIQVMASIAVQNQFGVVYNQTSPVIVPVMGLEDDGHVIFCSERLLKASNSACTVLRGNALELGDDDLSVRVTRESFIQQGQGWTPDYNHIGFISSATGPVALGSGDLQGYLSNPEAVVIRRPDFRLLTVDGNSVNGSFINSAAVNAAPAFLASPAGNVTQTLITGFFPVELNGKISKVIYDAASLMTRVEVNGHWSANSRRCTVAMEQEKQDRGERYPKHGKTSSDRIAEGSTTQPAAFIRAAPTPDPLAPPLLLKIAGTAGGGKYHVNVISGVDNSMDDGSWLNEGAAQGSDPGLQTLDTDDASQGGGTNLALALNLYEDGPFTSHAGAAASLTNILPVGSYHLGRLAPNAQGETIIQFESCLCGATTTVSVGSNTSSTQETSMTDSVEVADRQIVMLTFLSRVAFNPSSEKSFLAFYRVARFACGRVTDISGEGVPVTVFTTAACS